MSFIDAFDVPFMYGDKPLKRLSIRDLTPFLDAATSRVQKRAIAAIPEKATPAEKAKRQDAAQQLEAVPDDLGADIFTLKGAIAFTEAIARKNGLEPEALIDEMPAAKLMAFAAIGSGLFTRQRLIEYFGAAVVEEVKANTPPSNPTQPGTDPADSE